MEFFTVPGVADGVVLSCAYILPSGAPKAVVQIVHGMCSCKEVYFPFMENLASNGYVAVACDLRGHGASVPSPDDLGYMGKGGTKALVGDVREVSKWAKEKWPSLPLFLVGHSMGSMIVRSYVKHDPSLVDGLVVTGSPSRAPEARFGKFVAGCIGLFRGQRFRSKTLAVMCLGKAEKKFSREGRLAWLVSDASIRKQYLEDPSSHFIFTVNGFRSGIFNLLLDIYDTDGWVMTKPEMPVLFVSGAADPLLVSPDKFAEAVSFMRKVGYKNVSSKLYPGLRHEILNEVGKERIWADVVASLDSWV